MQYVGDGLRLLRTRSYPLLTQPFYRLDPRCPRFLELTKPFVFPRATIAIVATIQQRTSTMSFQASVGRTSRYHRLPNPWLFDCSLRFCRCRSGDVQTVGLEFVDLEARGSNSDFDQKQAIMTRAVLLTRVRLCKARPVPMR